MSNDSRFEKDELVSPRLLIMQAKIHCLTEHYGLKQSALNSKHIEQEVQRAERKAHQPTSPWIHYALVKKHHDLQDLLFCLRVVEDILNKGSQEDANETGSRDHKAPGEDYAV